MEDTLSTSSAPSCTVARKSIHRLSRESTRTLSSITARLERRSPTHPSLPYQSCALCGFPGLPLQEPVLRTLSRYHHYPNCTITRYMCIPAPSSTILLLGSPSYYIYFHSFNHVYHMYNSFHFFIPSQDKHG